MTPEDFEQIRAIVTASEERLIGRQDRAVETIAQEMSQMRAEFNSRLEELSRRIDAVTERLDTLANAVISIDARQSSLLRAIDKLQTNRDQSDVTMAAQQRAIDQLAARIAKIERELHPGQQQ